MTSATLFRHLGMHAALLAVSISLAGEIRAQSAEGNEVTSDEPGQETRAPIDRGELRLKLLETLVLNERQEVALKQSRLVKEATALDQERNSFPADPSVATEVEKRRIDIIDKRLSQIGAELAEVETRLPLIDAELAELKARLDGNDQPQAGDEASQWLDSKRQIQEALVYLGSYNALIDGDFGPRTAAAIKVYQELRGQEATGVLSDDQETVLLKEAGELRAQFGMKTVKDPVKRLQLSYPSGLLSEEENIGPFERRYRTEDGEAELLVTSSQSEAADLSELFSDLLGRYQVQYQRKHTDWFVLAGLIEEGRIIYDIARTDGERMIRARLSYPADWREIWSPFSVIMFNTFGFLSPDQS